MQSPRKAHALVADKDVLMLDAPVSGGTGSATAGTLTFMAGRTGEAFAKGEPILQRMGMRSRATRLLDRPYSSVTAR